MNPTETRPNADEVSPEELAAVEIALRHIDCQYAKQRVLATMAQWFLVLRMFKELERHFTRSTNRRATEVKHRALLTSLMGIGDILLAESEGLSEQDFKAAGYTREMLTSNVRYLRNKYEQWFVDMDDEVLNRVWGKLMDEREVDPNSHLPSKV